MLVWLHLVVNNWNQFRVVGYMLTIKITNTYASRFWLEVQIWRRKSHEAAKELVKNIQENVILNKLKLKYVEDYIRMIFLESLTTKRFLSPANCCFFVCQLKKLWSLAVGW